MTRLAAAAAGLLATLAFAQPAAPSLALDYEAPAECPSASDVFADGQRLRGELTGQSATPDVRARVRMLPSGPVWNADVETFSRAGAGRRKLEADTCQRAAQAVAVVLALALANPLAPLPDPPGPPPIEPVVEAVRLKVVPFVNLLGAARFGVLPNPMPLAQLGGGVEAGWLRVELRLGLAAPALVQGPIAAANVESWFQASLSGCAAVVDAAARLELCVALDTALLSARGMGVTSPGQGSALWVGALAGVAVRSQLWRGLGVVLDTGVGAGVARPRFFVQRGAATELIYEAPLLTGRFGLGLQWRW